MTKSASFSGTSEQQSCFKEIPHCYASMDRKPLTPYDPLSHRSRLAVDDAPVPLKNSSTIDFDGGIHVVHKRRFITTADLAYTGEPQDPRANQGMLADSKKFRNFQNAK